MTELASACGPVRGNDRCRRVVLDSGRRFIEGEIKALSTEHGLSTLVAPSQRRLEQVIAWGGECWGMPRLT
jgi:hypothetical protein